VLVLELLVLELLVVEELDVELLVVPPLLLELLPPAQATGSQSASTAGGVQSGWLVCDWTH
jgi:hypothetical protein